METAFTYNSLTYTSKTARDEAIKKAYKLWAKDMIVNHNCTVGIKAVMHKLHVSKDWIIHRLCPAVEYVKIDAKVLQELNMDPSSPLLFNIVELKEYIKRTAVFTRQTIVIDLMDHMTTCEKLMAQNDEKIVLWDTNNTHMYGKRSNRLLNKLEAEFENVNEQKRSQYKAVEVPAFDFWEKELSFQHEYPHVELAYRDFFRKGMIRINLFGKAFFVQLEDSSSYSYPLTIQYQVENDNLNL